MENKIQLFASGVMLLFTLVALYISIGVFNRWDSLDQTIGRAEQLTAALTEVVDKTEALVPKIGEASQEASEGIIEGIRKGLNREESE